MLVYLKNNLNLFLFSNQNNFFYNLFNILYKFLRCKKIDLNSQINIETLKKSKIINSTSNKIKILGSGDINVKINLNIDFISKSAKEKLEKAGGVVTLKKEN